ncbi:MAG: DNA-3-methyladenine glycosylase family protein [Acidimicrobiales bacterium]
MVSRIFDAPVDGVMSTRAQKATQRSGSNTVVWPTRTPAGPATAEIIDQGNHFEARAWGPGAEWALDQAPRLIGVDDDVDGFEAHHDVVADLMRRHHGFRIGRSDRVLEALVPAVLGQKVQAPMAKRSLRTLNRRFGERAPGPHEQWLQPSAEQLARLPFHEWHQLGVERKRATIIRRCAERVNRLEEITTMSPVDAETRLLAFPGIGPWTSAIVRTTALGDPDAPLVGDYHLPNTVSFALAGEPRGDDNRMLELLEPYRGHRGRVTLLLKLSGQKAPKYGPRLAFWGIEDL